MGDRAVLDGASGVRVLICGGRNYGNFRRVREIMERLKAEGVAFVVTGGAPGADQLADREAERLGIDRVIFPANWTGRGTAAGFFRNEFMFNLTKPDKVVAFPGGPGTAHMVRYATEYEIDVERVFDGPTNTEE